MDHVSTLTRRASGVVSTIHCGIATRPLGSITFEFGASQKSLAGACDCADRSFGERWPRFFDQFAAKLRWIRVLFRLLISRVLFSFYIPRQASIYRGSIAGAQCFSRQTICQPRHLPLSRLQRCADRSVHISTSSQSRPIIRLSTQRPSQSIDIFTSASFWTCRGLVPLL